MATKYVEKFDLDGTNILIRDAEAQTEITELQNAIADLDETVFTYRGTETDADECLETGVYSLSTGSANLPYDGTWLLEVQRTGTGIQQIARLRTFNNYVYTRYGHELETTEFGKWLPRFDVGEGSRSPFQGKRILCVGDSFLRGSGSNDGNGWGYYIKQDLLAAKVYIATAAGFYHTSDAYTYNFQTAMEQFAYDLEDPDHTPITWGTTNYPDLVIVSGGRNDYLEWDENEADVKTAVTNFLNSLRSLFPTSSVWYFANSGITGWFNNVNQAGTVKHGALKKAEIYIAQRFDYYNYNSCVDLIGWFYGRSGVTTSQDTTHLNGNGYRTMARLISARVGGGDIRYRGDYDVMPVINSELVSVQDERLIVTVDNEIVNIKIPNLHFIAQPSASNNDILTIPAYLLPTDYVYDICIGEGAKTYGIRIEANNTDFGVAKTMKILQATDGSGYPASGTSIRMNITYVRGSD